MGHEFFGSNPIPWDGLGEFVPWDDFFRPIPSHAKHCMIYIALMHHFILDGDQINDDNFPSFDKKIF